MCRKHQNTMAVSSSWKMHGVADSLMRFFGVKIWMRRWVVERDLLLLKLWQSAERTLACLTTYFFFFLYCIFKLLGWYFFFWSDHYMFFILFRIKLICVSQLEEGQGYTCACVWLRLHRAGGGSLMGPSCHGSKSVQGKWKKHFVSQEHLLPVGPLVFHTSLSWRNLARIFGAEMMWWLCCLRKSYCLLVGLPLERLRIALHSQLSPSENSDVAKNLFSSSTWGILQLITLLLKRTALTFWTQLHLKWRGI